MRIFRKKKKLADLSVADVIEAALEQIKTKDGYTEDAYFLQPETADDWEREFDEPGPYVGATCAIGGVEQAIWRLTGEIVTAERFAAGFPDEEEFGHFQRPRATTTKLYAEAMTILNRAALRTRSASKFEPGCPIEQLTFAAPHRTVVRTFKRALKEARTAAA